MLPPAASALDKLVALLQSPLGCLKGSQRTGHTVLDPSSDYEDHSRSAVLRVRAVPEVCSPVLTGGSSCPRAAPVRNSFTAARAAESGRSGTCT